MKTPILFFFLLIIALVLYSCDSVSVTEPCEDIFCENGGICVEDSCICEPWYEGEFCEQEFREKFYGTYNGVMLTSTQGTFRDTFDSSITLEPFPNDIQRIIWDSIHYLILTDEVKGIFHVPWQPATNQPNIGSMIDGYGSIKGDRLFLVYNLIHFPGVCPETLHMFSGVKSN